MARFTSEEISRAVDLNDRGYNLVDIARMFERDPESLRIGLKLRGIKLVTYRRPAHNAKSCDEEALVRDFLSGASVLALSRKYELTRASVELRLARHGVSKRDRSTANRVSMAQMPKEKRMERVKSAHDAVRGRKASHEEKVSRALTLHRTKDITHGPGESELASVLEAQGVSFSTQYPIDIHNVDVLALGSIIVEITTVGINRFRSQEYRERTKKLMEFGFDFLGIVAKDGYAITLNADNLVSDINTVGSNPSPGSEYRVVRCSYYTSTSNSFNPDKASSIDSAVQPIYTRYKGESL